MDLLLYSRWMVCKIPSFWEYIIYVIFLGIYNLRHICCCDYDVQYWDLDFIAGMKGIELNFGLTRRFHYNISDGCKQRAFWIPDLKITMYACISFMSVCIFSLQWLTSQEVWNIMKVVTQVDAGAKVEQRWSFPLGWPRICALETLSQSITQLSITIGMYFVF